MSENNLTTQQEHPIAKMLAESSVGNRLSSLLGSGEEAKRFGAILLNIALEPNLANCSPTSIVNSALRIAELGLPIAKHLGQAYIVRYKNDAEASIGYKGWLSLLERAGKSVKVNPVFNCDEFKMVIDGFEESISLIPNYDERRDEDDVWVKENLKGILISIKDHNTSLVTNQFVPFAKIQKIVGMSPAGASKYSPYQNWAIEMFQAKAIKYVLSKTPLNETIAKAVEVDNRIDKEEVLNNISKNIQKKTFSELESAVKAFGLQLRLNQNLAIIVGNSYQKEHLLKDLGFTKDQKNQWVAEVVMESNETKNEPKEIEADIIVPEIKTQNELVQFLKSLGLESEIKGNSNNEDWIKISSGNTKNLNTALTKMGFILHNNVYVMNITHLKESNPPSISLEEVDSLF